MILLEFIEPLVKLILGEERNHMGDLYIGKFGIQFVYFNLRY